MKNPLLKKDLFSFSKKERLGIIVLLSCIILVILLPFTYKMSRNVEEITADTAWLAAANAIQENHTAAPYQNEHIEYQYKSNTELEENILNGVLFKFDPNTLDAEGFKKLGLREKTIQTIINYRKKGGKFRKPDDLKKIYGLRQSEFEKLFSFISIDGSRVTDLSENQNIRSSIRDTHVSFPKYTRTPTQTVEINSADQETFESLYGIGPKLALRIINFRDKLGGFYSIDQLAETYGIPDSTFQKIKPFLKINTTMIKKININTANYNELNQHPYINSKTAFQILKYRKENSNFTTIEEVKTLVQANDSFEKIMHYIKTE